MRIMTVVLCITVLLACAGCCKSIGSLLGSKENKSTEPPVEIVESPQGPPGGSQVLSDGKAVWPPKGPGCENLVKCCDAASKKDSAVGLACQLSLAADPDCAKALQSVKSMITQMGQALPPECK
jgi:hypothetical protein